MGIDAHGGEEDEGPGDTYTHQRKEQRVRDGLLEIEVAELQPMVEMVSAPSEEVGHLEQNAGHPDCCVRK